LTSDLSSFKNDLSSAEAEIKEWKRVVETWVEQHEKDKATIENYESCLESIEKIKAKAYKEFAERLKAMAKANEWNGTICGVDIDNVYKELVGEDE
jgi:glutamate synthase domain-containing protein 3